MRFGLMYEKLEDAALAVAQVTGLPFSKRTSRYWGGDYRFCELDAVEVRIVQNRDLLDGEAFDSDWPMKFVLLDLCGPTTEAELRVADKLGTLTRDGLMEPLTGDLRPIEEPSWASIA